MASTHKIDFAVYSREFSPIIYLNVSDHIIELDDIDIPESVFKSIFYQTDNFAINPDAVLDPLALPYISFSNKTVSILEFCLFDSIIKNIENDLGLNISMFSPCTNITLAKEINSINTLCDLIPAGNVLCSMSWPDIVKVAACEDVNNMAPLILSLSVVFSNPTVGVKPTVIKFNFKTTVTVP